MPSWSKRKKKIPDIAIVFKFWTEKNDFDTKFCEALQFLKETAGVYPLHMVLRQGKFIAFFANENTVAICRDKMSSDVIMDQTLAKYLIRDEGNISWLESTHWITIGGIKCDTTRQQIIDYIEQNGGIEINEKDIYTSRFDGNSIPSNSINADIECLNNEEARKLVMALNSKPMKGQKTWVQIKDVPKGRTKTIVLGNLDPNVTKHEFAEFILEKGKVEDPPNSIMFRSVDKHSWMAQIEFRGAGMGKKAEMMAENLNCSKLRERPIWVEWIGGIRCVYCGKTNHHWRFCLCHLPNINELPCGKVRKPKWIVEKAPAAVDKLKPKQPFLTKKEFMQQRELTLKKE